MTLPVRHFFLARLFRSSVRAVFFPFLVLYLAPVMVNHGPVWAGIINSEPNWLLCDADYSAPALPPVDADSNDPDMTYLFGDEANLSEDSISTLLGDVHIRRGSRHISADKVEYNKAQETVDARGNVQAWDFGQYLIGESAHVDLSAGEYRMNDVHFLLIDRHGQGFAEKVEVSESEQILTARNATYTTCPTPGGFGVESVEPNGKPAGKDWQLKAGKIALDRESDRGTARNVTVRFKDVPVLYTPYLTFPLSDKRKSGFLIPSFGVSEETGTEVTVPYYWNIAPNQDATLGVRAMTDRGALFEGEYRYLTSIGSGKAELDFLPNDRAYDSDRAVLRFQHNGTVASRWHADVNFNWVSDEDYFEDMGRSMSTSSTRFLEQRADVRYTGNQWWALGRLHGYQTVDETVKFYDRPYDRLPQFQFGTRFQERNRQLNFQLEGEWVYFHRDSGEPDDDNTTGQRLDVMPSVSYPIRTASSFMVPKISLRHTRYSLDGRLSGDPDTPERTLPIFSFDGGLFLERSAEFGGRSYTHTLEPRVYYLAVPYEDQSDLPLFDTGEYTFNFGKMFRENRFSGADRQGDANQVTVALTSRLLDDETGEEALRASIGQIRYLRDREVFLDDGDIQTNSASEIIAEVAARASKRWRLVAGLQYDVEDDATTRSNFGIRYQPNDHSILNIGYRYDRDYDEQATASFRWPLTRNWGTVGRWSYALPESRTIEAAAGFEYDSCCWAARAVVQRFINGSDTEFNNAFFLQLELKGLAGVGSKTGKLLSDIIPGYQNNF